MAVAFVSTASGNYNVFSPTPPFNTGAFNVNAGNLIVGMGRWNGTASSTIVDNAGNTYTKVSELGIPGNTTKISMFYAQNAAANAATVVTLEASTAGANFVEVYATAYSGASTSGKVLDTSATGTVDAGTPASSVVSASFTTTSTDVVIVGVATVNAGGIDFIWETGYTNRIDLDSGSVGDKILTVTASTTTSCNDTSKGWALIVGAYMSSAGAAPAAGVYPEPLPIVGVQ